jgi:hypothetical protein
MIQNVFVDEPVNISSYTLIIYFLSGVSKKDNVVVVLLQLEEILSAPIGGGGS